MFERWLRLVGASLSVVLAASAAQVVFQKSVPVGLTALDAAGNVYVAGASVTKLDSNGNQIYSKPLGLTGQMLKVAADLQGNLIIVGWILTDDLATSPQVFQPKRNSSGHCVAPIRGGGPVPCMDAFVAKIDGNGNLAWASYLGGGQDDAAFSVATDAVGTIYVAGWTLSTDFPFQNGFQSKSGGGYDGFVTAISADGTHIIYSSYAGSAGNDEVLAIAVDAAGSAYVAGYAGAPDFPSTAGSFGPVCPNLQGAFLIKVAPGGSQLVYGGCIGGHISQVTAVAVDSQGAAYLGGYTNDPQYPVTPGAFQRLSKPIWTNFITKIAADGTGLAYSAVFNGSSLGSIGRLAVDTDGSVYAAGSIQTDVTLQPHENAFPPMTFSATALEPCFDPTNGNLSFLMKLNAAGSAATYFSQDLRVLTGLGPDGAIYEMGAATSGYAIWKIAGIGSPVAQPYLSADCVLNGANYSSHGEPGSKGVSPGELVVLKGAGLGPQTGVLAPGNQRAIGPSLGGVQVFFDELPAPMVYAQDQQVNAVAPYGIAGRAQTTIKVQYQGASSLGTTVPVSAVSLASFLNFSANTALVVNQDNSVNSAANPATAGQVVTVYVTGAGQTVPASTDGEVWQVQGSLAAPVSAAMQAAGPSVPVVVQYAGPVPETLSALEQINIVIPSPLPDTVKQGIAEVGTLLVNVTVGNVTMVVGVAMK
jgi:uncharacterized protein (TIGR03437 family)